MFADIKNEKPLVQEYYGSTKGMQKLAKENGMTRGEYERYIKNNRVQQPIALTSLAQIKEISELIPDKKLAGKRVAGGLTSLMNFIFTADGVSERIEHMYVEDLMLSSDISKELNLPYVTAQVVESYCTSRFKRNYKDAAGKDKVIEQGKERMKETMLSKYGVDNAFKSETVKSKIKATMLDKYGEESFTKTEEYHKKRLKTNMERYGVSNASALPSVQKKSKETRKRNMYKKYGVRTDDELELALREEKSRKPVKLFPRKIIPRYANWHETSRVKSYSAYRNLINNEKDMDTFIQISALIRGVDKITTYQLAEDIGIPQHTLVTYLKLNSHPKITVSYLNAQQEVLDFVAGLGIDVSSSLRPNFMNGLEIDGYAPEYKFAIEFNGSYWHSEEQGKDNNYHQNKTELARKAGVSLMHIWEYDWVNPVKQDIIKSQIAYKLHSDKVTHYYARKLVVKSVSKKDADNFYDNNHIQGKSNETADYGLYDNDELIACMGFGRKRFSKKEDNVYELIRFATKKYTSVAGGASKLFKAYLKDNPEVKTVVSFSNDDFAFDEDKSVYTSLGFIKTNSEVARYKWVKGTEETIERHQAKTAALKKGSVSDDKFQEDDTERSYMERNGYRKIWNSSTGTYVFNR